MHTEEASIDGLLVCRNLVKRFEGKQAIDGVSFEVRPGEIVGLLGPNGAGKTTLIRMIIDIFRPDAGEIRFLGRTMQDPAPPELAQGHRLMRDLLGYLPEERGLYRRGRLGEVLEYLGQLRGLTPSQARERVVADLEVVGLSAYKDRPVIELSKGMTQRAQMVAASVHRPRLLVLDEPFSGLDPIGVQWAIERIRTLHAEGATILLSAHQMAMVERLCHRVVMINGGRRVLYGTLSDIRSAHAPARALIETPDSLDAHPDLHVRRVGAERFEVTLGQQSPETLLQRLLGAGIAVRGFTMTESTLEEIFLEVVRKGAEDPA